MNGEIIAAARRTPGHVIGDGTSATKQLAEDPRCGMGDEKVMTRIQLEAQADMTLHRVNVTVEAVPEANEVVMLRCTANLSTGGTCS